jgi:NADPH:quinone reductase-like Zn-dependent oxidoreductase
MAEHGLPEDSKGLMQAVRLHADGGAPRLSIEQVAVPRPGPGEALVRVHAAAITRDELDWPVDRLPAIPSYEVSGVVHEVAADVVVVLGAAGGVGHAATQLARARGAYVIGVSSRGDLELVRELGADEAVARDQFEEAVEPVDLVFDTAGGDALVHSAALVRPGGRIVSVAEEFPEPAPEKIDAVYFVVEPSGEQLTELTRLVDDGRVLPAVDSVFPLADAPAAFARVQERGKRGKVVLEIR